MGEPGRPQPALLAALFPGARQQAFPAALADVALDDFYFAINDVRPSLIRVEADEATYNLHILIRFELEQALLTERFARGRFAGRLERKVSASIWASRRPTMPTACCKTSTGRPGWSVISRLTRWAICTPRSSSARRRSPNWAGWTGRFAAGEFGPLREWLARSTSTVRPAVLRRPSWSSG